LINSYIANKPTIQLIVIDMAVIAFIVNLIVS